MFSSYMTLFLVLVSFTSAWMPEVEKEILAADGTNLFNQTSNHTTSGNLTSRWLPASGKIRGVNLGSLFVFEPWIANGAWYNMGCGGKESEFDCVSALGQTRANQVFKNHWNTFITKADITKMKSYGLNTIRIPVGYWMLESIVYDSERFPRGAVPYLERICGWASDAGFYIIIDMHGAPGAQVPRNSFTGQYAPSAGFYVDWQYARAQKFLVWLTNLVHTKNAFRNVGMIGLVNEPLQDANQAASMRSQFYPNAYNAIRAEEKRLGLTSNNFLHIQPMNSLWGSGNPNQYMTNKYFLAYDDHRYVKWDSRVAVSQSAYLSDSCHNNRAGDGLTPTIVGEFSLSVPDNVQWTNGWHPNSQKAFYRRWFAAQITTYEKNTAGWVFWTWKSQLGDYRWSYQDAVAAGVIPGNVANVNKAACNGF